MQYQRGSIGLFFRGDPTLKAWYPLNGRAIDESGHGYNGTIYGNVVPTPGKFGLNYYFGGTTSDYISCGSPLIGDSGTFTILAWAKWIPGNDPYPSIYCEGNTSNGTPTIEVYYHDASRFFGFYYRDNNNVYGGIDAPINSATPNIWHFGAVVSESKSLRKSYFDGLLVGTNTTTIGTLTFDNSTIGAFKRVSVGNPMKGNIAEVAIFSRALSTQEIAQYYRWATSPGPKYTLISLPTPANSNFFLFFNN